MWLIGAIIAAAGMNVYIVWGSVSLALDYRMRLLWLTSAAGIAQKRWREELSGVSRPEAKVPNHFGIRF